MNMPDRLTRTFAALADPTRRAILARLAMGETTVNDLARPFAMSGPAVSKHLRVLENAGLITRGRAARWRPCRIEPQALKGIDDWLDRYRQFWEERLDRLEDFLTGIQTSTTGKRARKPSAKERPHGRKK